MPISHARLSINATSPTQITPTDDDFKTNCTIQVQNLGEVAVYIGGEGMTLTDYGVSIVPGGAVTLDNLAPRDELFALSSDGIQYIAIIKVTR